MSSISLMYVFVVTPCLIPEDVNDSQFEIECRRHTRCLSGCNISPPQRVNIHRKAPAVKSSTQLKLTGSNHFIIPTNAHDVKNVELLKHIKIMEAAPTCFGLQSNNHQGAAAST
jgi:hypothetical protein